VYNLLMQKYYPQERPVVATTASLSASSSDENLTIPEGFAASRSSSTGLPRSGSGAARKFHKRASKRMSGSPAFASYNGYNNSLEGLAEAMVAGGSPEPEVVAPHQRRNTIADTDPANNPDRVHNRRSLGGRSAISPQPKPTLNNPNAAKRKSVIFSDIGNSFKSLFKTSDKIKEVKGVFSVDSTTSQPPAIVVEEIMRVLDAEKENAEEFKLKYKQKGYLFKCRYPHQRLEFTLEVCKIKKMDLTGVKSKRIKGDLWVYKDYCQRVITKLRL